MPKRYIGLKVPNIFVLPPRFWEFYPVALIERGWEVSKSAGDAAEWNADDLDDDF